MNTPRLLVGAVSVLALGVVGCSPEQTAETTTPPLETSQPATRSDEPTSEPADPEPAVDDAPPESDPEPEPEGPTIAQIGETLELSAWDEPIGSVAVTSVETSTRPYDEYGQGPTNGTFVIFEVAVEAEASFDVYDGDFYVLTDDGTRYDLGDGNSYDAIDYDDALDWVELNPGEKKSGLLAFDLPASTGSLHMRPITKAALSASGSSDPPAAESRRIMTQRMENPELGLSVRLDLTFGGHRILPSHDPPDRIVILAGNGDVAVSIPADDAIRLANMITDAVDQLDGRRQP